MNEPKSKNSIEDGDTQEDPGLYKTAGEPLRVDMLKIGETIRGGQEIYSSLDNQSHLTL